MRKLILLSAVLAMSAAFVESAWAAKRPLAYMTSGQLKKLCGQHGGGFSAGGSDFSCSKDCKNAGGKPDSCAVNCSSKTKTCSGHTPDRVAANATISQVLNGTSVAVTVPAVGGRTIPRSILGSSGGLAAQSPSAAGSPMTPATPPKLAVPQIR